MSVGSKATHLADTRLANAVLPAILVSIAFYLHHRGSSVASALVATSAACLVTVWVLGFDWPFGSVVSATRPAILGLFCIQGLLFVAETLGIASRMGPAASLRASIVTLTVILVSVAGIVFVGREGARWAALSVVGLHLILSGLMTLGSVDYTVDVREFQRLGAEAVLSGQNPYEIRFPDIYSPEVSDQFYGPGISVDGRLTRGFPYPPASLLPVTLVAPFADIRWAHRIAITVTALLMLAVGRNGRAARIASVIYLLGPGSIWMAIGGWTEVFLGASLALSTWAFQRRSSLAPLALGFFFALKQYTVLFVPLIPLLRANLPLKAHSRRLLLGMTPWALLTIGYALWDVRSFVDAVVTWQFVQPFRPDSLSLLVTSVNQLSWPPPAVYAPLALGAGLSAAVVASRRAVRSPSGWAGGVGVVMMWFVLFSKQAFVNYYFLAVAALCLSLAAASPSSPGEASAPRQPA